MSNILAYLAERKRPGENGTLFWQRMHDQKHGHLCECPWNALNGRRTLMRLPGAGEYDTVPAGKRLVHVIEGGP